MIVLFAISVVLITTSNGQQQQQQQQHHHCSKHVNDHIQACVMPVALYAKLLHRNDDRLLAAAVSPPPPSNSTHHHHQPESLRMVAHPGGGVAIPNLGTQVFREICSLIRQFNDCVRDQRRQCPHHITISLIDSSYGFLCSEGYDMFIESADCLSDLDRRPLVNECHDRTLADIQRINDESGVGILVKMERMCGVLNMFAACVRDPIRRVCGTKAWTVTFRVLHDTTRTLIPDCIFTGSLPKMTHPTTNAKTTTLSSTIDETTTTTTTTTMTTTTTFITKVQPVGIVDSQSKPQTRANITTKYDKHTTTTTSRIATVVNLASSSNLYQFGDIRQLIIIVLLSAINRYLMN